MTLLFLLVFSSYHTKKSNMGESSLFTGQPIFNQLLSLIPRGELNRLGRKYQADRYCKSFRTYDHLVTMLYSALHQCSSLREVITGMQACAGRLKHLGLRATPRRSTLADANERRSAELFGDLYHYMYQRHYGTSPDSLQKRSKEDRLFIVDSTIISLFSSVMCSTGNYGHNGRKKGGIKAHVLLRAKDNVPALVNLTEGIGGDASFLPKINLPKGSIVVMDKAYRNFKQYRRWTEAGITWITRLHERTVYGIERERPLKKTDEQAGVIKDLVIKLGNPRTRYINALQLVRLITFTDVNNNRELQFITNNMHLSAATVAALYKKRWQIESFFKRIKQNFQLHFFLGDNENAIRIQVWCALIADLLIKIVHRKIQRRKKWSMANLTGLLRLHLGTYINLYKFLTNPEKALLKYEEPAYNQQMNLFHPPERGA